MPIPVDAIPTLSGIPTEIQTAIVRYVFEDKHVRVIQKNDHIGVHEPKHGAIRLSCGEFYNKFSPLFEMESCAMFGNLQMNDKEFAEASDEQRQEWQEATHLEEWDRGYSYFSTRAVVYFLRSTEAGRRLAKLTAMDFRGIKWRGVFEILSAIGDVKHVTRLALDRGVHEHMTSATAQPAGSSIMKEVILDPNRTELQTRSWIDKHQNNAYLWSRLYERCGDDLDLRIGFRLSHWEHCQTRPGVSHELTGVCNDLFV